MDYCSEYVLDCCRGFVFATPRLHVPESQASIGDRSARSHAHASVAPPSHPGPAFPPPGAPPSLGPRVGRVESGSDPNRSTCGSRTRWVGFSGAFRASPGHARHGRVASRRRHDAGTTTPRNRGSRGISGMPGIRGKQVRGSRGLRCRPSPGLLAGAGVGSERSVPAHPPIPVGVATRCPPVREWRRSPLPSGVLHDRAPFGLRSTGWPVRIDPVQALNAEGVPP